MTPFFILGCFLASILFIFSLLWRNSNDNNNNNNNNLPPGNTGWPIIGEALSYFASPSAFIRHKMTKYSTTIFKTSFFSHKFVFVGGPAANKFIFSNEGKLFKNWLPDAFIKLLCLPNYPENSDLQLSWQLLDDTTHKFFKPDSLRNLVHVIDSISRDHVDRYWIPHSNTEMNVYPVAKEFSINFACRVMLDYSNSNSQQIRQLAKHFLILANGIFTSIAVPINFPGMPYHKAMKGRDKVREMVMDIVKRRREEAMTMRTTTTTTMSTKEDLLGHLVLATDSKGQLFSEEQIVNKIISYLFAGFYSTSSVVGFVLCRLAQHPLVYQKVVQEQSEIVKDGREGGKVLCWDDIQKMHYTWNVVRESMRLVSHEAALFREVITDFTYQGYTIPKGWKIGWDTNYTHSDPKYFKGPENFDPSRFEAEGPPAYTYIPFGGGPHMCKGNEFSRISLLVFLHNMVSKFRFEMIHNHDQIPAKGALRLIRLPAC